MRDRMSPCSRTVSYTHLITYAWNMIYASTEEELNSLYNELVDKCNQLGIEECVKWGQEMWADAEALAEKYSQ